MTRRRHTPEQIVRKLREADRLLNDGGDIAAVARHLEVSEQTYLRWRTQYGGMKADDTKRLKELQKDTNPPTATRIVICAGGYATSPRRIPGGDTAGRTRSCTATATHTTVRRCSGCGETKGCGCLSGAANVAGSDSPPRRRTGCVLSGPTRCGRWTTSSTSPQVAEP